MQGGAVVRLTPTDHIDELLAEVVQEIHAQPNDEQLSSGGTVVILDAEIQGIRCLFIRPPVDIRRSNLSPREREIGRMVARGYANKTIASVLEISTWTVGTHLRRIFAKLGVSSRAAMVAQLANEGILQDNGGGV
jgi:DNA-binding CsgD family transcriptional regulator